MPYRVATSTSQSNTVNAGIRVGPTGQSYQNPLSLQLRRFLLLQGMKLVESDSTRLFTQGLLKAHMPLVALAAGELLVSGPQHVLALSAHPDDLEFVAGGTLRRMCLAGSIVHAVTLTEGEKRGFRPHVAAVRQAEQRLAAKVLGYASVQTFTLPDFGLPEDPRLEKVVDECYAKAQPDVVFAPDPQELVARIANRDHKALGRTVLDTARQWAHSGVQVYLYGTRQPNTLVDVTGVLRDKLAAVEAHASQFIYLTAQEYKRMLLQLSRLWATDTRVPYVEGFYRLM